MKLQLLIERYIAYRQALGESFKTNAIVLRAFGRAIGARAANAADGARQVRVFLDGKGPITRAWFGRHSALLGFYDYAITRGYVTVSPLPVVLPQRPPPFVPHIYTQDELRRLLQATDSYQRKRSGMEPVTMRVLILLLYGAGLRLQEAIALDRVDVDMENLLLTVRHAKFSKTRLIPLSPKLGDALAGYVGRRPAPPGCAAEAPFFTLRTGTRLNKYTIEECFLRVRQEAGVRRAGARYQPRLHDLRHTFAVRRLTSWYRQGVDVQKLLPQLSVYLGQVHLASTQVYLSMTPELLAETNGRFERYVGKEGSHD